MNKNEADFYHRLVIDSLQAAELSEVDGASDYVRIAKKILEQVYKEPVSQSELNKVIFAGQKLGLIPVALASNPCDVQPHGVFTRNT